MVEGVSRVGHDVGAWARVSPAAITTAAVQTFTRKGRALRAARYHFGIMQYLTTQHRAQSTVLTGSREYIRKPNTTGWFGLEANNK